MFLRQQNSHSLSPSILARSRAAPAYKAAFAPAGFTPQAINNAGNVVGTTEAGASIWSRNRVTTMVANGSGMGINNRGDIVGGVPDGMNTIAFVRTRAGIRYIRLEAYEEYNRGMAINNHGQVAGHGQSPAGEGAKGYLNFRGVTSMIDSFGGDWSYARSINSSGQIVGTGAYPDQHIGYNHHHAFVYKDGVLTSLGTLGGRNSEGWDINDAGQIVGSAETTLVPEGESSPQHAFLYEGGVMKDLGNLTSEYTTAYAINQDGVVVGQSGTAFIYLRGEMIDLNTLVRLPAGYSLIAAFDINDAGQILARAALGDDWEHWVRLTPVAPLGR